MTLTLCPWSETTTSSPTCLMCSSTSFTSTPRPFWMGLNSLYMLRRSETQPVTVDSGHQPGQTVTVKHTAPVRVDRLSLSNTRHQSGRTDCHCQTHGTSQGGQTVTVKHTAPVREDRLSLSNTRHQSGWTDCHCQTHGTSQGGQTVTVKHTAPVRVDRLSLSNTRHQSGWTDCH